MFFGFLMILSPGLATKGGIWSFLAEDWACAAAPSIYYFTPEFAAFAKDPIMSSNSSFSSSIGSLGFSGVL